ncbi:MAG: type II secretion system protein M [Bdellovibrionales bacterium]|nr:type II secretion system protein M [Bdellovibrionales bacterium]
MGLSDKLSEQWNSALENLKDQSWYQQAQSSFQQLSPEQQNYVRWGSIAASVLLLFYFIFSAAQSANAVKDEYRDKQELLTTINQAGDEIRRLKGQNAGFSTGAGSASWKAILQNIASQQGLTTESLEVSKESPGSSQSMIQETLVEANIKGIFVRPLVGFLYQVEHNSPPMKLKGLQVENGAEGALNVKMILSGFMPKTEKK